MLLAPGTRLGPYEIESVLGSGGMGEVYKARDTRLHRAVAIKQVRPKPGGDLAARIMREARAAARLNHPHIATLHDVLEQDGSSFLVMEYIEGESLRARIAAGPVDVDRALDIGIQLADALTYAHRAGVVHRDVKPANVMLTPEGKVKLLDLGVALAASMDPSAPTETASDVAVPGRRQGTPAYMAPEQLAGQPAMPRSDVYAAGLVIYELLTGRRPFETVDVLSHAMAVASSAPPAVSSVRREVPPALDAIVARALARDPDLRYGSAGELRDDLARIRELIRTGSADLMLPQPRKRVGPIAAITVVVAVLVAVGWWLVARGPFLPGPAPIGVLPALNASEDPELEALGDTLTMIFTDNLSGTPGARVVSANPGAYRHQGRDVQKAARDVGGYLLVPQLQKTEAGIALETRLMFAGRGQPLWTDRFSGTPFDVAEQFIGRAADALEAREAFGATLSADDRQRLRRLPTHDATAFGAYVRGRMLFDRIRDRPSAESAVAGFEQATAAAPSFALAHAGLSQALTALYTSYDRQPAVAERAANEAKAAMTGDPTRSAVQEAAARADQGAGLLESAERHAREAIRIAPDSDGAHRLLAGILASRHDLKGAIDEAQISATLRPESAPAQYALGYYNYAAGRYQDAIEPLTRATVLQPDLARNFSTLGAAYQRLNDFDKAIGNYNQSIRLGPTRDAYSNLGVLYYSTGQFAESAASFRKALDLDPASATTHHNLADAYERLGKMTEARAEYLEGIARADAALKINMQDVAQLTQKAFCEAKVGRFEDAKRDIATAITLSHGTDKDALLKSAVIKTLAKDTDGALKDLEAAIAAGYPAAAAAEDWDLRSIKDKPKFKEIVNRK